MVSQTEKAALAAGIEGLRVNVRTKITESDAALAWSKALADNNGPSDLVEQAQTTLLRIDPKDLEGAATSLPRVLSGHGQWAWARECEHERRNGHGHGREQGHGLGHGRGHGPG